MMSSLLQDLRMARRSLLASPAVAVMVIASLALAIGANAAVFSIVNSLLLRPLPIADPAQLVHVTDSVVNDTGEQRIRAWSNPVWRQIRQRALFADATAWSAARFNRASGGESRFVDGLWADGGFFDTLGVHPVIGRMFTARDDQRDGGADGPVAVLSYDFWQREYAGASDAIGQRLQLNGATFTAIGVAPPEFFGLEVGRTFDVAVPLATEALMRGADSVLDSASSNFLSIVARLKSGQTVGAATAELRRAQPAIRGATIGEWDPEVRDRFLTSPFAAVPAALGSSALRRTFARPLQVVAAIVGVILLIGCVNVANVLMARAAARRQQVSVQLALGAGRARIVRQSLFESVLLAAGGAMLGVGVAALGSRFLVAQLSSPVNRVFLDLSLNWRVLLFASAIAASSAVLFGVVPAWRAARAQPLEALRPYGRSGAAAGGLRAMNWMVTTQVALSLVLVFGAGLFLRSFVTLTTRNLGLTAEQVLVATIDGQRIASDRDARMVVYERVRQAVSELPTISEAATSFLTPLGGGGFTPAAEVAGGEAATVRVPADAEVFGNLVSPGWFAALRTSFIAGRDFTTGDRRGASSVAIVNETFARRYLPGRAPLGRTVTIYPGTPRAQQMRIVGVVRDAVYGSPRDPVPPTWYAPIAQAPPLPFTNVRLTMRVRAGSPLNVSGDVAAVISAVDPRLNVTFRALDDQLRGVLTRDRLMAQLAGFFGALALLLSGLGLYGVTAYAVSLRRAEFGIRMALGATPRQIGGSTVAQVMRVAAVGVVVGVALSWWGARIIGALLYGVTPRDPATIGGAVAGIFFLAMVAAWLPARRAARADLASILR
jgi:putative ABC transport system permease protein